MMKQYVLMATILLMPLLCFAQAAGGQVRRPAEPTGYDVSFSCNISSATLYIDGSSYGSVSGTRFLKTGPHSITLEADGYEPLTSSIVINSANTSFSFTMKEDVQQQIINKIINNMVLVEGGTFTMGGKYKISKPVHQVTLSSYSIGKYEVTQEEWEAVMGYNPSNFKGAKRPVENVSWDVCQEFIRKLNTITGKKFRLPTEAEWEYAARGGNKSKKYKYAGSNTAGSIAWYNNNSNNETHNVGTKQANELGLYDMSGNVFEWCQDWYGDYSSNSQTNPKGPADGYLGGRIIRGGSWNSNAVHVSFRFISSYLRTGNSDLGLRLAL